MARPAFCAKLKWTHLGELLTNLEATSSSDESMANMPETRLSNAIHGKEYAPCGGRSTRCDWVGRVHFNRCGTRLSHRWQIYDPRYNRRFTDICRHVAFRRNPFRSHDQLGGVGCSSRRDPASAQRSRCNWVPWTGP